MTSNSSKYELLGADQLCGNVVTIQRFRSFFYIHCHGLHMICDTIALCIYA